MVDRDTRIMSRREFLVATGVGLGVLVGGVKLKEAANADKRRELERLSPSSLHEGDPALLYEIVEREEFTELSRMLGEAQSWYAPTIATWGEERPDYGLGRKKPTEFIQRIGQNWSPNSEPNLPLGLVSVAPFVTGETSRSEPFIHMEYKIPSKNVRIFARTVGNFPVGYRLFLEQMRDGGQGYTLQIDSSNEALNYAQSFGPLAIDGTQFPLSGTEPNFTSEILILPR